MEKGKKDELDVEFLAGMGAGTAVLDLVKRAKHRLLVVSPWLSPATADLAVVMQREGVPTTVVTSNEPDRRHQMALSKLVKKTKRTVRAKRWWLLAPGIVTVLVGLYAVYHALTAGFFLWPVAGAIALVGAGAVMSRLGSGKHEWRVTPRVQHLVVSTQPSPLLHAKIYVADDRTAIGSPNFTVSGLRHNVESVAILRGHSFADEAVRRVNKVIECSHGGQKFVIFDEEAMLHD